MIKELSQLAGQRKDHLAFFAVSQNCWLSLIYPTATATAKSLQLCPTLCDPIDGSPSDSSIPGILQARTLEWVAISFSSAWKWKVKVKSLSRVQLLTTPWTAAYQAPPSMGFSRQEYWSGVPLPSPLFLPLWLEANEHSYLEVMFLHGPDTNQKEHGL